MQDAAGGGTEQRASGPVRERARAVDVVVVVVVVDGMHVMLIAQLRDVMTMI